jgi:hypothetical protein
MSNFGTALTAKRPIGNARGRFSFFPSSLKASATHANSDNKVSAKLYYDPEIPQ